VIQILDKIINPNTDLFWAGFFMGLMFFIHDPFTARILMYATAFFGWIGVLEVLMRRR
jgi:hypothetical protein